MAKVNAMKTIKEWVYQNKINSKYDVSMLQFEEIEKNSNDIYDMMINSFILGYAQGSKATKAEMKKEVAI